MGKKSTHIPKINCSDKDRRIWTEEKAPTLGTVPLTGIKCLHVTVMNVKEKGKRKFSPV